MAGPSRFRALASLGAGANGEVDLAWDGRLGRVVAIKTSRPDGGGSAEVEREARLLAWLEHPAIVPVHDVLDRPDGRVSVAMQALRGETLAARLAHARPLRISEVLRILRALCEAMAAAHARGVIHLDLKPANVLLDPDAAITVIDWGLARVYDPAAVRARARAQGVPEAPDLVDDADPGIAGTLAYMPLEQATRPRQELGPAADVFAVGVMLYEMLTGVLPFPAGDSPAARARSLLLQAPPDMTHLRGDVSPALVELCSDMLVVSARDRIGDFRDVLDGLDNLADFGASFASRVYAAGEVLFHAGEPGDEALLLVDGEVEVRVPGARGSYPRRGVGEVVGELAMFAGGRRTATVAATRRTVVKRISYDNIARELDKLDPLVGRLVRGLAERLAVATPRTSAD